MVKLNFRLNSLCKRRLTWSPKRVDSTNQKRLPANAHAHRDVFQASLPWQDNGEVKQMQHFYHHGDTYCHRKSGYITIKLHGTSTCRCNNNVIFSGQAIFKFLPSTYAGHVNLVAAKHWQFMPNWKDGSTVVFVLFNISFLPKYRVML